MNSNNNNNLEEGEQDFSNQENQENQEPKTELELLQEELEKVEIANRDHLDKLQRSMAEFDNFRKRTLVEKASMYENGTRDSIEKFLPILDNFERAMISTSEEEKSSNMYKGLDMIFNQFLEVFEGVGVEEVVGVGEEFDPNIHNAVMHIEDETLGANVVAEVLQKGYILNGKVIRPSMVKVAN
ncbi:MAG: nucleotide exchange factor GrpE [bacterium]